MSHLARRIACISAIVSLAALTAESVGRAAPADGPAIRLSQPTSQGSKPTFEVIGLDAEDLAQLKQSAPDPERWAELFSVRVASDAGDLPPMLGTYRVEADRLRFAPRFPLEPGLRYRAVFVPSKLAGHHGRATAPIVAEFSLPRPPASATTRVVRVDPTSDTLPENLLRFYLHFSAPMARGDAYKHVHILRSSGQEVDLPFLELSEELWNSSGTRLTLLLDPGRIKRGLKPRLEAGPILEEGKSYTLVIDRDWPDAHGQPLATGFRKPFRAGPPDDQSPDPSRWKIRASRAGTYSALVITFPEILDHALLEHMIGVVDAKGRRVAGRVKIENEETSWHFTPEAPWREGEYRIVVDKALEDVAGNSIERPFEVDEFRPSRPRVGQATVELPFRVRAEGAQE